MSQELSPEEQIVVAVKMDTMQRVVDGMLTTSGHEPLISKLEPSQLAEFWAVLSNTDDLKNWVVPLQSVLGTRNLTKLQWLNKPLKIAKIIASSTVLTESK